MIDFDDKQIFGAIYNPNFSDSNALGGGFNGFGVVGGGPSASLAAVPEPATLAVLGLTAVGLLAARRCRK